MAIKWADLAIPVAGGVANTVLRRNASGDWAKTINTGIDAAAGTLDEGLQRQYDIQNPYLAAGRTGIQRMSDLNPAIAPSALYTKNFVAPTAEEARMTPGYQFAVQEGQKGQERIQNAAHGLISGGSLKSLERYRQGMADTNYQQTFQNKLTEYGLDKDLFQGNEALKYGQSVDQFNREKGLATDLTGVGQTAASTLSGAENNHAEQIAKLQQDRADAIAAGDMAKAQSTQDLITGLTNTAQDLFGGEGGIQNLGQLGNGLKQVGGDIVGGLKTAGGAIGGALGDAGSAIGGAIGSIGALGTFGIAAGLAVGAKLWANSQAHRQADKLTGEGGIQFNLNHDLEELANSVKSGEISQQQADPERQKVFQHWADQALQFGQSGDKKTVVRQMLQSYSWDPALKDLALTYQARLDGYAV